MLNFTESFRSFMAANGLPTTEPIIADDTIRRFRVDGEKNQNGTYKLRTSDDFAVGWCRSHKTGETLSWHSASSKKLTKDERRAAGERIAVERKKQEVELLERQIEAAKKARAVYANAELGDNGYLTKKRVQNYGVKLLKDDLLVPIYDGAEIANLQRIPAPGTGEKRFLGGGKVKGCYYQIGNIQDQVVICEGYATGATIHEITGLPVVIAFYASNLLPVGKKIVAKWPTVEKIFAADNDQWTTRPNGEPHNPGVEYANAAAAQVGGRVVHPLVPYEQPSRPTDFNDVYLLWGSKVVTEAFRAPPSYVERQPATTLPDDSQEPPFRILGYNNGVYYYLPKGESQIVELAASGHTMQNLFRLAPLEFWQENYGAENTAATKIAMLASNSLIAASQRRGVFRPENKIRGLGGWLDGSNAIFNCGNSLWVNGEKKDLYAFASEKNNTYVKAEETPAPTVPCTTEDAYELRKIMEFPTWDNKLSGALLAGWCVIAPVCATLPWRPHVWITGPAQSGKSTIVDGVIGKLLDGICVRADGGTTEAGLRQLIGYNGLPVLFDEAESEDWKQKEQITSIMQIVRKSSRGGYIVKGGINGKESKYPCRLAFCFSAINPLIKHLADETRISVMSLRVNRSPDALEHFRAFEAHVARVITPEFSRRLLARTMYNLPTLLKNIQTFTTAAAIILGDRRAADQIGAMLGGLFLLHSVNEISLDKAKEWIETQDWQFHTAIDEKKDHERLLEYLCTREIRMGQEYKSVGELIKLSLRKFDQKAEKHMDALRRIGIWPKEEGVYFANRSEPISEMLRAQPWSANWKSSLLNFDGSSRADMRTFAPGLRQRAVVVPLQYFFLDDHHEEAEQPEFEGGAEF